MTLGAATAVMASSDAPVSAKLVEPAALAATQLAALSDGMGITHGPVVDFEADSNDVTQGVTITFKLSEPLHENSAGTLAYWDVDTDSWRSVPSVVGPDRLSISAQVDHFTWFTDLISDATHAVGSIFDARASKPTCQGPVPDWVQPDGVVFVDDQNAPLLWCAGHDPNRPELLVVKASVNRGYGVEIQSSVAPEWSWNSFLDASALDITKSVLQDAQGAVSAGSSVLLTSGQVVPGTAEVDFGFTEQQVRAAPNGGVGLVSAQKPDVLQLVMSMIVKQLADTTDNKVVAYGVAVAGFSKCLTSVAKTRDATTAYKAFLDCADAAKDGSLLNETQVTGLGKFAKINSDQLAAKTKAASKKFFAIVTLANLFSQAATFVGDVKFADSVRQISIFPVFRQLSVRPVTGESLKTADVEDGFGVSAGPLVDGIRESDTGGFLMLSAETSPALGDFTGDGIADGAAAMEGSSGAGGSYSWISLYTNGGKLLGSWDGSDYTDARTRITSATIADQKITLKWTAVDNTHPATDWRTQLSWDGKQIVVDDVEMLPADANGSSTETGQHALTLGLGGTLNDLGLFADEDQAMRELQAALGPPEQDSGWAPRACGPSDAVERRVAWGLLQVRFLEGPHPITNESARYLIGWYYGPSIDSPDSMKLKTDQGVGLGDTLEQVRAAYPDGYIVADDGFSSIYGGPVLEIFLGDYSGMDFEFDSESGQAISISSGGGSCPGE